MPSYNADDELSTNTSTNGKEVLSFADWYEKKTGIRLANPDEAYRASPSARAEYQDYLKQAGAYTYDEQVDRFKKGEITAIDMQGELANTGIPLTPEQTTWLNNEISQQVTNEARDYNTVMRDTAYTSAADQLSSIGLNPASVISTGGAGIGSSPVSQTGHDNPAQEKALASFNNNAAMTRTLVSVLGGLGSAGIYGGTRSLAKRAIGATASAAAHSGLRFASGFYRYN